MSIQWFERLVGSLRGPGAKRSRKRLNDALRPTRRRRRHALNGFESLEERRVLAAVLGIGTGALVGNDLTDLGNNGAEGSYSPPSNLAGFDGVFFANLKPNFGSFQAAFNVFDNRAGGAGDDKALWGFPAEPNQLQPMIVGANFATTHGPTVLTSFTITSGEDTPERDPTRWKIEGSNDTTTGLNGTWTTIYDKADGGSHWTQRQQVNRYSPADGDVFLTSQPFTAFRMVTTATGIWTMGSVQGNKDLFQLSEIEFFSVPPAVNLSVSSATGAEVGTTAITVTATAASVVSGAQTVSLAVMGTGIDASDYALSNSTITIASGATTGTVTFSVKDDLLSEGTETATLTISSPSAGITLGTTLIQNIAITDDDTAGTSTYGLAATGAYRVVRNGSTIEIYNSTPVLVASRAMGTAAVVINGTSGNDTLTIDSSGGDFTVPITFNGGSQTSTPGDSLTLTGGTFATGTFAFTNANDGTINLTGNSQISYTGLEPIVTTGTTINDLILTFNGGAETITVTDAAGAAMTIDSTLGESLTFANPSSSLTINAGTGDDLVSITSVDPAFRGAVSINGDAGSDTVNWNAVATLGSASATGNVSVVADVITVTNAISADTGRMIAVSLTSAGNVALSGANADVTTGGGTFTVNADSDANGTGTFTSDDAGSAVSAAGGAILIKAADVVLTGTLAGTSTLTLAPSTAGRTIGIGGGAGMFNLSDAELALLTDGFSSITIGDAAAGNIDINTATFTDSVVLNTSGRVNDATGADINVGAGNTLRINGSVAPGQTPGILNVTGDLQLNTGSTVFLADDFNDNSIDPAKWNVVTAGIPQAGASVIETGGRIQLTGRGHLNTAAALNPSAPGGLVITGTWQFGSGDDFIHIVTRSNGTPTGTFGATGQGIELTMRNNTLSIIGLGLTVSGGIGVTIPQGGVSAGRAFQFTLTDNGTTITGTVTQVGNPSNTATVTATSNFVSATNRVTFTNRESLRVSYLDDVVIRSASVGGYNVEIGGTTPGESATSHDQINVTGTVTIVSGVALNLSNFMSNYTASGGDQIVIVNNDASDAISGTFVMGSGGTDPNGGQLANGDTITNFLGSSRNFRIFYNGGDGNDVLLVENSTPAVVYVDDSFTANLGQTIADADLGTTGSQPAIFGVTAFTSINAALAAVTSSGTIIVNGGTYAETISLTGTRTIEITGSNSAQTVIIDDLTTIAGTPVVIEGSSNLTVGDADSRTLAGVISGSGSFTKQGSGTYTLSGSNLYTGATNINAGTLRVAGTPAVPAAPAGAVGIYTFDSVSGTTVNNAGSAGATKNGALVASSGVVVGGRIGNAMSTSGGLGARMQIAGAGISLAGGAWTGAAWFNNLFTDGDWNTLFVGAAVASSQLIIEAGSNRLGVYDSATGFRPSGSDLVPAANSGWHHVAAVGSGTTTTFYRNGVPVGTADRKDATDITSVGASPAGGGMQRFAQLIDEVYIYQSALTAAQVMTLYNSGAGIGAGIAANPIPDSSTVTVAGGAFLDLNGSSETIGSLAGAGTVTSGIVGSPTLTVGDGNGSGSFSGVIQNGAGTVSLAKTGAGTQTLSGSNLYTGATAVNNGTLVINGSVTSNVTVTTPGVLNGSGTVTGNVLGNGTFSPGNSPGIMTIVGNFTPSGTVNFEANSAWTTAGTHFDQYLVTGLVNMAGSMVTFTNTADTSGPAANSVIKLIDNNGTLDLTTAPTTPTDGALVTIGSRSFKLFYNGGDGNDVTLESQNTAPTAANSSVTTNEDFTYTFSTTDFSFSDTDSGDVLSAVKVTTIESAGELEWFNGSSWVDVTQDQEISKADIDANRLRFVPDANANGAPYATFSFKVQDTGGPVLSVAAYTFTINVSAINDLPVAQSSSVTTNEDTAKTFAVGDFLFTDVEGDSLASITISSLNLASGDTLKLSGTDVTVGQTITASDIPNLVYTPDANANGAARSIFGFTANDAGSGTVAATMTINVTAVDDAPVLTINDTSTYVENAVPTVVAPNLTLTDPDGPNINGATVSLTTNFNSAQDSLQFTNQNGISGVYSAATGILSLSGSASAATYQTALRSITYSNNSQNPTTGARSVQFSVGNSTLANPANGHFYEFVSAQGGSWASANAAASARTLFGLQGYLATVTSASENAFIAGKLIGQGWMGGSDAEVEGTWRWVTGPEAGQQFWQGAGGGSAVNGMYNNWTPGEPNNFGPFGEDYAHFRIDNTWNDYRVDNAATAGYVVEYGGMPGDPTLLQLIGTATVIVVAVNDAPTGANNTLTTNEDTQLTIVAADFGFSDVAEGHGFNRIQITTLPATGTLKLDGVAISAGDFATKSQLDANQLTFDPVANASGSPYTVFTLQVEDDGGTANSGVNLDLTPNTITINVSAINDLPVAQASSVTTNEDTLRTFAVGDFLFTDVEGDSLASITISSLSLASGDTLKLSGTDVTVGRTITVADISNLVYFPFVNANGAARSSFGFTANDADSGTVVATMTINVTAVNDVSISDASVTEGGNLQFNVSLDSPLDFDAVITYSTANGSATTADNDYAGQIGQTVTIPAGSTTAQITVQTTVDNKVELDESLFVSLNSIVVGDISLDLADIVGGGNGTGTGGSGGINPVTGAVVSSGDYGPISGSSAKNVYSLVPSSSFIDGVFIPDGGPTRDTAVPVSSTGITATGVGDSANETWDHIINGTPNLSHYYPISFATTTEIRFATNKGLTIDLDAIEVANPGQRVTAFTALAAVANTNSNGAEFTIIVDGIIRAQTYVQGGQSAPMSVAIGPDGRFLTLITTDGGSWSYDDNLWGDPTLVLSSLSQSVVPGDAQGLGTILNDDSASVSIGDTTVTEGGNLLFNVTLSNPVDVDTVITFSTADGSATTADSDYTGQTLQTLTIPAGQTSGTITIVTAADNKVEFNETMTVQLTGVNASGRNVTIDDGSGQGTMVNNDSATISIGDASVTEGGNLVFNVSLSNPVDLDTVVTYSTQNGTATTADNDYTGQTGLTVTIPAGSTTAQITVMTTADNKVERNEEISVSLTGVSNDLLAYYNFDGQSNNQYGTAPNATLVNTAFIGTGGSGYTGAAADGALDLGGLYNRAAALVGPGPHFDSAYNNNSIAVSFWQYDRGTDRASSFWIDSPQVDGSRGFQAHNPWDGEIIFDNSGCCTLATRQFAQGGDQGRWQHFVFQKDASGNKQIWIDGGLRLNQLGGAAPLLPFDGNMTIGAENLIAAGGRSLNGKIDEFAVWDSALSPAEIAQLAGGASTLSLAARDVVLGDIQGLGSILNDDTATVTINNPSMLETNSGTTTLAFTVSLDRPVDVAVSATSNTANGITNPATTADSDYVALTNGTVTFSAGSTTSQTVNVTINGDSKLELNEQLQLVLSALSASGRSVQFTGAAATLTAIGTITNDDTPRVGTILQPTSVTTTMGSFSAPWATTKMIDKSGLSVGYTSNVTNFDTYIAGNPTHSYNAHQITPADAQAWASSNSVLTGTITFNLGSMYVVESMALWNRIDAGIGGFNLLADADGDFNSGAVTVLSNRTASLGRSGAQVFGFTPTTAQYLRLQVLSDAHSFPFVIINEIAFEGTQITVDATPPTSQITALSPNSSSLVIPITVTGSDGGPLVSGVKEYDLYYSTGGGFVKFATVPPSSPSTTFTGTANTTYWFRSLGRDNAGNEETKTTSDTSTRFGDVAPPATQVTTAVPTSGGLFTVSMTGSKATGSALAAFDVYVSIDGGTAVLIRSANAVSLGGGNYSGKIPFQGILDGTNHTYNFYSRGRDDAGNVEAAPVAADLSVTYSFAAAGLKATAIDVQKGANQRSYVRNLDILFSSAAGLSDLLAAGRVKVERFGIDATSVNPGTGSLVTGFGLTQADNSLRLDFGANGLGGLREAGNGFYRILIDQDGNNSFGDAADGAFEFFRLWGDVNGDGKVDSTDLSLVTSQVGRVGNNVDGDLDGNGVVNSLDRFFATQQNGKKLRDSLFGWLDD